MSSKQPIDTREHNSSEKRKTYKSVISNITLLTAYAWAISLAAHIFEGKLSFFFYLL